MISPAVSVIIAFEVAWLLLLVWCLAKHEKKFIDFEDKMRTKVENYINKKKIKMSLKWLSEQGIVIPKEKGDK